MCGIVGYFGKEKGATVVVDGLKKLEYRGYDSWGIAVKSADHLKVYKEIGKIGEFNLKKELPDLFGDIAIGHTRWATHGGVTKANAHPHLSKSKRIAVVHNGIIENYQELRSQLEKKGVKFISETDTEVIPNLIEAELDRGINFEKAVIKALKKLEGNYAVAILDNESKVLIGARKGSPLVLGVAEGEFYLASDVPAFLKYTDNVVFLDDYDLVKIKDNDYSIINIRDGKKLVKKPTKIEWSFEEAEKGGHPHFMIKEMLEQPHVLEKTTLTSPDELEKAARMINKAENIYVIACGTALHAGIYGSYLLGRNNKINLRPISAGEFPYFAHLINKNDLVLAVSQSGETADVLEAVKTAKLAGAKILSLVNVMGSTLMRMSDFSILTKAGPEICVLSTKAFTSQVAMFVMLSFALIGDMSEGKRILHLIKRDIERITAKESLAKVKKLSKELSKADNIYAIGRGFNYAIALEACLKIKEVSYIHAEGFAGGDLKHGPIALIEKDVPTLVFVANDGSEREIISNSMEVRSRGAKVIGISFEDNPAFHIHLPIAKNGIYSPISAILYGQLMAYYIALEKDLDPDKPRNLAKSVTVK